MKKESLGVYECPEAEEVKLVIESKLLGGPSSETPSCPTYSSCTEEYDYCGDEVRR